MHYRLCMMTVAKDVFNLDHCQLDDENASAPLICIVCMPLLPSSVILLSHIRLNCDNTNKGHQAYNRVISLVRLFPAA